MLCSIRSLTATRRLPLLLTRTLTRTLSSTSASSDLDTSASHTVSAEELKKFTSISNEWWDTQGPFKYLHTMNQARTQYIRSRLTDLHHHHHQSSSLMTHSQLSKLSIVDIGCGGGLASESLARSGAHVTGVDAAAENIAVARIHAMRDPALSGGQLTYRQATAEQLVGEQKQFDAVVSLEVIEHVRDPVFFVKLLVDLAKPGAPIFISTMNRTLVSLVVDVVVPEYVLGVVPKGTHEHAKFVPPAELEQMLSAVGAQTLDVAGLVMNPLSNSCQVVPRHWGLLRDAGVQANYILMARKRM